MVSNNNNSNNNNCIYCDAATNCSYTDVVITCYECYKLLQNDCNEFMLRCNNNNCNYCN